MLYNKLNIGDESVDGRPWSPDCQLPECAEGRRTWMDCKIAAHVTAHVHTGVVMLSEIIPNTFVAKILTNYEIREGASVGSFGIVDPLSSKFF